MERWIGIDEFVAAVEAGSFVGGARALGVSPAHMSRAIARLEERLNARLFHRTTRRIHLTATGKMFLEHGRRLVANRNEAIRLVREQGEQAGELQGELHVTCSIAIGERHVAALARRFAVRHPRVRLTLDLSNRVVDIIGEGYDLAIRTGQITDERLVATRIAGRRIRTCAAPRYLAQAGMPETPGDLERHDCLVGSSAMWHFLVDGQDVACRPQPRWRCNSGRAILEAAIEGMGICQLPDFYVREALAERALLPVLERLAVPEEPVWAVYPDKRHLSAKARAFIDLLRDELQLLLQG